MVLPRMCTTVNLNLITYLLLVAIVLGPILVDGEPNPMARPTRPKVFTSPEELRRYLDLVRDYYNLNGKARYGKRAQVFSASTTTYPWDAFRMILFVGQRVHKQNQIKDMQKTRRPEKIRDFTEGRQSRQQQPTFQQSHLYDIVTKYYGKMQ